MKGKGFLFDFVTFIPHFSLFQQFRLEIMVKNAGILVDDRDFKAKLVRVKKVLYDTP